jgi:hypothetical protein
VLAEVRATVGPEGREPWRAKLRRARLAVRNAGLARSQHGLVLEAQTEGDTKEAG